MDTAAMNALNDVELHLRSPETPVNQLSGGERQGVVIARAMYFKSKLAALIEDLFFLIQLFLTHTYIPFY